MVLILRIKYFAMQQIKISLRSPRSWRARVHHAPVAPSAFPLFRCLLCSLRRSVLLCSFVPHFLLFFAHQRSQSAMWSTRYNAFALSFYSATVTLRSLFFHRSEQFLSLGAVIRVLIVRRALDASPSGPPPGFVREVWQSPRPASLPTEAGH